VVRLNLRELHVGKVLVPTDRENMDLKRKSQDDLAVENLPIYEAYASSPYLSIKHTSYFHVYQRLLAPFVGQPITFVEVGVYNGGSLFMWRDFLGPNARIIGVELNPIAKRWEQDGFEIWIGSQSDARFWDKFFESVGQVDVLLDDGGHSNLQQIQTVVSAAPHVRDGGLLIVEDAHTSYMTQFGNPSRRSFMNFAFHVVDAINSRFPEANAKSTPLAGHIASVSFSESLVAFHIDRSECFISQPTSNSGVTLDAMDYRFHGTRGQLIGRWREALIARYKDIPEGSRRRRLATSVFSRVLYVQSRFTNLKTRKFF